MLQLPLDLEPGFDNAAHRHDFVETLMGLRCAGCPMSHAEWDRILARIARYCHGFDPAPIMTITLRSRAS